MSVPQLVVGAQKVVGFRGWVVLYKPRETLHAKRAYCDSSLLGILSPGTVL